VYHSNELREGVGCRVPAADSDVDTLLDRTPPQRTPAVAGQGPHANGFAGHALLFYDVVTTTTTKAKKSTSGFLKMLSEKKSQNIIFRTLCFVARFCQTFFEHNFGHFFEQMNEINDFIVFADFE
jgi:hypothetical protein